MDAQSLLTPAHSLLPSHPGLATHTQDTLLGALGRVSWSLLLAHAHLGVGAAGGRAEQSSQSPAEALQGWGGAGGCSASDVSSEGRGSKGLPGLAMIHLLLLSQPLDYESKKVHTVVVEALNKFVDPRFVDLGTFRDQTIVRVSVLDVDEPPEFRPPSNLMEVQEDAHIGSVVGVVTALDPDTANHPVR